MLALAQLGLRGREHLSVRVLSQGQKRRTALSRLVLSQAKFWVLDEPFVALDLHAQTALCGVINQHLNQQGMVLPTALIYAGGCWDGMALKHQCQPVTGIGVYMQVIPLYSRSN
jgi:ABC-type transport system involved in cytochrome c biogenesis ATPase subunit